MQRRDLAWQQLAALVVSTSLALICQAEEQPTAGAVRDSRSPNIVIVTFDTLRADHVSAYGYPRATTFRIDGLAAEGALFETAYAISSTTLPSHATLFSSRYPDEHGARKNGLAASERLETLAERLRASDYQTAAFVSSFVLEDKFGLAQGFDHYDDDFDCAGCATTRMRVGGKMIDVPYSRRGIATAARAVRWLETIDPNKPFFLWMHVFDPHTPYEPPEEDRKRFVRSEVGSRQYVIDVYDAEIRAADRALGVLLDRVASAAPADETLTIVTSDHGEGLGDHDFMTHGVFLYESMVRVPLVFHWPGHIAGGTRVSRLVAQVDLVPTLAGLTGLALRAVDDRGQDLSPLVRGEPMPEPPRAVFLQRRDYDPQSLHDVNVSGSMHAIREGHFKLIHSPEEKGIELYDLNVDPGERDNVASQYPDVAARLRTRLDAWLASQSALDVGDSAAGSHPEAANKHVPPPMDDDVKRGLKALGYVE